MSTGSAFAHLLPSPTTTTSPPGTWDAALDVALQAAASGIGRTRPNPPVGCVIVAADGTVLGRGFHARAGEAHAEVRAIEDAKARHGVDAVSGATAVVTLEPCAHHGRTPPCATRLIAEGVRRVVVGCRDPNPQVDGKGIAALRAAGIDVVIVDGPRADACAAMLQPFSSLVARKRPWVILKTATTLDGKVATSTGVSRFITGPQSRRLVHGLRDAVDAVVVGAGTALADDPALTVRNWQRPDGTAIRDPLRVLLDARGEIPLTHQLFDPPGALRFHEALRRPKPIPGVENVGLDRVRLPAVLEVLGARGLLAVLIEAGPRLAAGALRDGVVDELWWFRAPSLIGGDGVDAIGGLDVVTLEQQQRLMTLHSVSVGEDTLTIHRPIPG